MTDRPIPERVPRRPPAAQPQPPDDEFANCAPRRPPSRAGVARRRWRSSSFSTSAPTCATRCRRLSPSTSATRQRRSLRLLRPARPPTQIARPRRDARSAGAGREPLRAGARHARPRERAGDRHQGSWVFSQLFRVLGTGDRLFVHRRENPLPAARAEADVFEGRLIRFDDLLVRRRRSASYFSTHVVATHFFAPDVAAPALAARAPGAPLSIVDRERRYRASLGAGRSAGHRRGRARPGADRAAAADFPSTTPKPRARSSTRGGSVVETLEQPGPREPDRRAGARPAAPP